MTRIASRHGAPEGYDSLHDYFETISERAKALGVQRDTIRSWDAHRTTRLWDTSQRRVKSLLAVCRDLGAVMSEPVAIGRWLLTEQPALLGARPTDALLKLGTEGQRFVVLVAYGVAPVRPGDVPDPESFWRAVQAKLSDGDLTQIEQTRSRTKDFSGSLSLA